MTSTIKSSDELEALLEGHPLLARAKRLAKSLKRAASPGQRAVPLMKAQEQACRQLGFDSMHALRQRCLADFSPHPTRGPAFSLRPERSRFPDIEWSLGSASGGLSLRLSDRHFAGHLLHIGSRSDGGALLPRLAMQAIEGGRPLAWVNASGERSASSSLHRAAIAAGREADVRRICIDWDGAEPAGGDGLPRHAFAKELSGSSSELTAMMSHIIGSREGDSCMWAGRSISMLSAVLAALVHLRDNAGVPLTFSALLEAISFDSIAALSQSQSLPPHAGAALKSYLRSLPGYVPGPASSQRDTPLEQHGYVQMQNVRQFSTFARRCGGSFDGGPGSIQLANLFADPSAILIVDLPHPSDREGDCDTLCLAMCGALGAAAAALASKRLSGPLGPAGAPSIPILLSNPRLPRHFDSTLSQAKAAGLRFAVEFDSWQAMESRCLAPDAVRDAFGALAADRAAIAGAVDAGWLPPGSALAPPDPAEASMPAFRMAFCAGGQAAFCA